MSTSSRPPGPPDPGATCADATLAGNQTAADAPEGDGNATGEFSTLPAGPTGPQATMQATGMFGAVPSGAETIAGAPDGQATGVFDPSSTAAFDGPRPLGNGPAATEVMGATGAYGATVPTTQAGSPPPRQKAPLPPGSTCGRYVLNRFHAKGGMGEIWMAEDPEIGRPVALKRMLSQRPDQVHRFRVEAQVTGQLEHPGIVPVHELGVNAEGQPFYTMKFVQGRTLKTVVEEYQARQAKEGLNEIEQFRLLQMFISLCQTVAYAHSKQVLHRDLKPENVMLGPFGETILLDWGIAKVMGRPEPSSTNAPAEATYVHLEEGGEGTETRVGAIMGTPSYMAPEVAAGLNEQVDYRSDIYLLGATLYEMLTGRQPRSAKTAIELIKKAKYEAPALARKVNPLVPRALEAICSKAMAHAQADRYQTAQELTEDVQRFVAGEPVSAFPEDFLTRAWRWAKRHRAALARSAAAVLILGLSTFGVVKVREAERRRVEALRVADHLKAQDRARRDLKEFRRLADEARYYAATTDPVSENAPYFDPRKGEATALAALALADPWGPALDRLPLDEEKELAATELYDLVLLTAHVQGRHASGPESARSTLALLDKARPLHPPTRGESRLRASAYQQLGDEKQAREMQRLADDPRGASTALDHFLLGESYRNQANRRPDSESERDVWKPAPDLIEKAIAEYRQALAINPDHYWSLFQIGRCDLNLGRLVESVELLGACVALKPDAPWGYNARGLALAQQKRFAEAERDFDRALQLNPNSRGSRLNRGFVFWKQRKKEQARTDFAAVLQPPLAQRLIEAAYYRGMMHLEAGESAKALDDLNLVVAENPRFRPAYQIRARIHFAGGDKTRGLRDIDALIFEGHPATRDGWALHGYRGHFLRAMYIELPPDKRREPSGQALATTAVDELQQAIAQGGRAADLFDDLGAMKEHTGRVPEAIAAYSKGLEIDPKHARLRVKRAWAYELVGRHDNALADFTAAAQSDPANAEAHSGVGYVRALRKQAAEAQRAAELALLHGSDNYLVVHNVACIYSTLSASSGATADQDVAMALIQRALALWKTKDDAVMSEPDLIQGESAFQPLRRRPDFQKLLTRGPEKVTRSERAGPSF